VKIHTKFPNAKAFFNLAVALIFVGCVTQPSHVKSNSPPRPEKTVAKEPDSASTPIEAEEKPVRPPAIEDPQKTAAIPKTEKEKEKEPVSPRGPAENIIPATDPKPDKKKPISPSGPTEKPIPVPALEPAKKSDQELLDSALEFCNASNDFWERGDLENALDALDQAYSLVLEVHPDDDPEILQQRDDLRITISKRIIEVYTSRFTVANGYRKAIPLVMNSHVERAVKLLEGKDKRFFIHAYRRSGRYRPAIVRALNEAGLPEELSWLPLIESGFKVHALSRSRALGLWQFIASTGYKFGLSRDRWIDERMDPKKSTKAAIAYLKELHQIFGDWTTALAAYNCGEGTVLRAIRTQKINYLDNFWDLYQKLPLETAFYVPKFLAVLHILNDPGAHGITLPPLDPEIESEEVAIEKQVHLKTVAKYIDISYKELRDLNPELRYDYTPDTPYILNVPKGKGELFLAKIGDIPTWHPPVPAYVIHRVRRGESLSAIASRYGTSVRSIMARNGLRSSHYIKAGWKLKIPTRGTYKPIGEASLPISDFRVKGEFMEYVVRKGDSLWMIAGRFGTTTKTIQSINQLNNTHLRIGQVLRIPKGVSATKDIKTKTYRVLKGDTAFVIAQKHQMDLSEFLSLNHLTPRSTIFPGQVMLVKAE
jgi:membrane-bound lytic murein transglycosylase D